MLNEDDWDPDSHFILDGVYNGFRVIDPNSTVPIYHVHNYKSCYSPAAYAKVSHTLAQELSNDKLSLSTDRPTQIHAMGALPKKDGGIRIITDCSMPRKSSVNNYMKNVFSHFSYNTIDEVIKHVKPNCFMATIDLQSAYRAVPIHPDNRENFGLVWNFGNEDVYIVDNFLGFGSKVAPFIFNRLTDAVSRHMKNQGYVCYNYLDDFIIVGQSYDATRNAQLYLINLLRRLGFYISWPKVASPSTSCVYLGIIIDSVKQNLSLPEGKIYKLQNELSFWEKRSTATKKQMQILCGTLNYCCKVVRGGRIYMHHMISLLKLFNDRPKITLPLSFFEDLSWWSHYATIFNGQADFFDTNECVTEIYTDACLNGLGGVFGNDYFQAQLIPSENEELKYTTCGDHYYLVHVPINHIRNINILELLAVYIALTRWSKLLSNSRVLLNGDNLQVCYMLCKDRSSNAFANTCLKSIFWMCVSYNMYLSPCYIPSSANTQADTLSRTVYF